MWRKTTTWRRRCGLADVPVEEQDAAVVAHVVMHDGPERTRNSQSCRRGDVTGARHITSSRWSQSLALHSEHSHPHVTDDVLSDGRLQKIPEDLEAVQQRVRLIEVVCAAVAAETKQRRRVGPTDDA